MLPPPPPTQAHLDQQRRATGRRIRQARQLQRLTQESLAERSGLHRKTISKIELGEGVLTHDHLTRIAHGLGLPLWRLFWDE